MDSVAWRWGIQGSLRAICTLCWLLLLAGSVKAQSPENGAAPQTDVAAPPTGTAPTDGGQANVGAAVDPPSRVVRLSLLQGDVSVEPATVNQFSAAELNQVLTSGDRVYTDPSANAELEAGQIAVRLGGGADLTVTAMTDQVAQLGLASGSVHLRSYAILPGTVLEMDSPEAAITVLQPGDVRVDEDAAGHTTGVAVVSGQVQVDGPGISQKVNAGEQIRIHAGDPATGQASYAEPLLPSSSDGLDSFSGGRDEQYASGIAASADYLNAEATGSADLASYGSWDTGGDYGAVWFPAVAASWQPYCYGHWAYVIPWGWTWIGAEPWGFAPFHYGRWVQLNGRWGWLPGTRSLKPIYAPAMVAFVGGRQFSASLGYVPGAGVTAWFPLGPREAFTPWYRGSTIYLNRVNASNIAYADPAEARAFFNQRAVNVYANAVPGSHGYANRTVGTVAMAEAGFAAGQSVVRNQVRLPATQLALAPVIARPAPAPEGAAMARTSSRAVPPRTGANSLRTSGEGSGSVAETSGGSIYANRPAFVHTPAPPAGPRTGGEQDRQFGGEMRRGWPVESGGAVRQSRPAPTGGGGHESAPRSAPEAARPAAAPNNATRH